MYAGFLSMSENPRLRKKYACTANLCVKKSNMRKINAIKRYKVEPVALNRTRGKKESEKTK